MGYLCSCGLAKSYGAKQCRSCANATISLKLKGRAPANGFQAGNASAARHGHTAGDKSSPTYKSWTSMKRRCRPEGPYGLKGITVCERWQTFENFLEDMGERLPGTTLDRIDNDKGYLPGNVRWATHEQQMSNRRLHRGRCEKGCTCSRHTHKKCVDGCTCKKHSPPVRTPEWKARMSEGQKRYAARARAALAQTEELT